MVEGIERLESLLEDALLLAESTQDTRLLQYLHEARTSVRASRPAPYLIRVDVLAGRVFSMGIPAPCSRAELAVIIALTQSEVGLSRDALADMLYPDHDSLKGSNILKVCLHRVRRRIPVAGFILCDRGRLRLGASVDVDLSRLIREAGLLRARGGALNEEERRNMEHFRLRLAEGRPPMMLDWEWFEDTERGLMQLTRDVTTLLADDALRERQYQRAITLAHELVRFDPLDELAAEVAIRAFLLAGNHTAAVLEYRHYESRLERELDAAPSARLRALVAARSAAPDGPTRA